MYIMFFSLISSLIFLNKLPHDGREITDSTTKGRLYQHFSFYKISFEERLMLGVAYAVIIRINYRNYSYIRGISLIPPHKKKSQKDLLIGGV